MKVTLSNKINTILVVCNSDDVNASKMHLRGFFSSFSKASNCYFGFLLASDEGLAKSLGEAIRGGNSSEASKRC